VGEGVRCVVVPEGGACCEGLTWDAGYGMMVLVKNGKIAKLVSKDIQDRMISQTMAFQAEWSWDFAGRPGSGSRRSWWLPWRMCRLMGNLLSEAAGERIGMRGME